MGSSSPLAYSNDGSDLVQDMDGFQLDGDESNRGKECGLALPRHESM